MLHEKPNDSFHWKNKLDELDNLPGEPLNDKNASWQKLHNRLREKPGSGKMIWYWLAAACVLIVAGILWLSPSQNHNRIAERENYSVPEPGKTKSEIVQEETAVTTPRKPAEEKMKPTATGLIKRASSSVLKSPVKNENEVRDPVITKQLFPELIVDSRLPLDTTKTIATVMAPVSRKLRVVHINELTKPAEEMPFARATSSAPLQRNLSDHNNFQTLSLSKNASDNLVKIKLSPSN